MSEPIKVFVVTEGEYSDCHTVGVFTTREGAEQRARVCSDCFNIEEWILDNDENLPGHLKSMAVVMNREGNTLRFKSYSAYSGIQDGAHIGPMVDRHSTTSVGPLHGAYTFYMLALDEKQAIKIANERRIKLLALNLWKEPGDGDRSTVTKMGTVIQ